MKRIFRLLVSLFLAFAFCGCAESSVVNRNSGSSGKSVDEVLDEGVKRNDGSNEKQEIVLYPLSDDGITSKYDKSKIDLDLTELNAVMVYSQVNEMMIEPDKYDGMVIRMSGYFSIYVDEQDGTESNCCVIPDATACCVTGIEFRLMDGYYYPYKGENITVTGVFKVYHVDSFSSYCVVENAEIFRT